MSAPTIYVLFAVGGVCIVKGGDWFVDAASYIAEVSGIPKFIIGATIVSLATTLPEVMVSSLAAFDGKVDMAVGNVVGSVTVNIALILSLSLLFSQVRISRRRVLNTKMILFLVAEILLFVFALTGPIGRGKSLVLLCLLGLYLYENVISAKSSMQQADDRPARDGKTMVVNGVKFLIGIVGIVLGSRLLVDNGSEIARMWGVSEAVISLTAISIGTSLPELVTAVSALVKKEASLSVGNIFGANVFDIALVIPVCGIVSSSRHGVPLPISPIMVQRDFLAMLAVSLVATVPTLVTGKFRRWQGGVLVAIYAFYLYLLVQ